MTPRKHSFPELLYFFDGQGQVKLWTSGRRAKVVDCGAGDCLIVPANIDHAITDCPGAPLSLYGLAVDPSKIAVSQPLADLLPAGKLPRERLMMLDVETRIRRLLYLVSESSELSMLSAVAETLDLLACVAEPKRASRRRVTGKTAEPDELDEYLRWLGDHFFKPLTLEDAANACDMSRRKFTQLFKSRTGMTWLHYIQKLRIDHAISLLRDSDAKVTSIAFQTGFDELSTFYRVFKRITGKQPLEFRK